jgi:phage-related protein (TIGR01555 family)
MSSQGNEHITARLRLLQFAQSTLNMSVHDSEQEEITRTSSALSGIAPIIASFQDKLAAAAELPLTKLFGHAPSGLSTDDQSGTRNYASSVANAQELKLRDPIRRVIDAILHSSEGPTGGQIPENWSFIFNPLDEPTEQETAETAKTLAETDKLLIDARVLRPSEARTRIANDPESIYQLEADAVGESPAEIDAEANRPKPPAPVFMPPGAPVPTPDDEDETPPPDVDEDEE